jgi:hypothetical protein
MRPVTRRLLLTVCAFASAFSLSASVVVAASPQNPTSAGPTASPHSGGCGHAYGQTANRALKPTTNRPSDPSADAGENDTDSDEAPADHERPHNHGWYVSQVAKDHSVTGRAHGKAVSAEARSDDGKP